MICTSFALFGMVSHSWRLFQGNELKVLENYLLGDMMAKIRRRGHVVKIVGNEDIEKQAPRVEACIFVYTWRW